jgi:hypothetical protein
LDFYDAFALGTLLEIVRSTTFYPGIPVKGKGFLIDKLEELLRQFKECKIDGHIEDRLSYWINKFSKEYKEKEGLDFNDAMRLREEVSGWITIAEEKFMERYVTELTKTGSLKQHELINLSKGNPSAFIDKNVWDSMSQIERSDYSDAAKCLLIDSYTPAVMVALRGAEATLKKYYEHKTGEDVKNKTWRQITRELKARCQELNLKETFIGYLDYIGDAKRNFAQHPNKIYDQREAELIFMEVMNLVQDIYTEMSQT